VEENTDDRQADRQQMNKERNVGFDWNANVVSQGGETCFLFAI